MKFIQIHLFAIRLNGDPHYYHLITSIELIVIRRPLVNV